MSLFQKSVLNKYLKEQDKIVVNEAFERYKSYFLNPAIQHNIRESKEEQFQEGFLRELFVKILGYTLNPNPEYNLTTEFKNQTGAKKADGAILKDGKAVGVIELKSTKTKDLETVRQQAFDYKANQEGCVYVITSNFEKLRFYINNAVEYEEFNLFGMTPERFSLLYLCLEKDKLLADIPLKIKEASLLEEANITKQFYKDYSVFKRELFGDLIENNLDLILFEGLEEKDIKLLLYKKSQKLIDRFLFIFFAEDRGLLPPNSISLIIQQWEKLIELDEYQPLYDRYKKYFGYMNTGFKGKQYDVYAYNGGLFEPDEILDNIKIDDKLLKRHTAVFSAYDFDTEVDVNILGHIFENSLSEIEEVTAQLSGEVVDKKSTKRKKEGVFYTPKYITQYIVDNTVGKLCEEKKVELGINEEEFTANRQKATKKRLLSALEEYRKWLLELTICDPACGSGAFLNQALDFLIKEHRYVDELNASLFASPIVFEDVENQILENNIFGVDINEESVDIARLSLWLRTAKKGRKLTTLNENIKCGNSLIDDPEVAGDKAFKWEEEFPDVFAKGGFDVIIGNPPYVRQEYFSNDKQYLESKYVVYHGLADLYVYFFENGITLLKPKGIFSIIVANKWLKVTYAKPLREWIKKKKIIELIDFGDLPVFEDATAYPCIVSISNITEIGNFSVTQPAHLEFVSLDDYVKNRCFFVNQNFLESEGWRLTDKRELKVLQKIKDCGIHLHNYTGGKVRRGIVTGYNDAFIISEKIKNQLINENSHSADILKPFLVGKDVKKYTISFEKRYLIFTRRGINIDKYPAIKNYLLKFRDRLEPKPKDWKGDWNGRKPGFYKWYEIQDSIDYYTEFEKPKIIYPNICRQPEFTYDKNKFYTNQKCFIIPKDDKYLLGVLNSRIFSFLFRMTLPKLRGGFFEPGYVYLRNFPITRPDTNIELSKKIIGRVDCQLELHQELQECINRFCELLLSKFEIEKPSKKLQNWDKLYFKEFLKELKKTKVQLSLSEEAEWMQYFEEQKQKALEFKTEIDRTDKEIDRMVYELYGLTEEEIRIVEEST